MRGVRHFAPQRFPPRPPFIDHGIRGPHIPGYPPRPPPGIPGPYPRQRLPQRPPNARLGPPRPPRPPFYHQPGRFEAPQRYPDPTAMQFQQRPHYPPAGPAYPQPPEGEYEAAYEVNVQPPQQPFFPGEQGNVEPGGPQYEQADQFEPSQSNQMQQLFDAIVTVEHEKQFEIYLENWENYYKNYQEKCRATFDASTFQSYNAQFQSYFDYLKHYRSALENRKAARISAEFAVNQISHAPRPSKPEPQFLRAAAGPAQQATELRFGSTTAPPIRPTEASLMGQSRPERSFLGNSGQLGFDPRMQAPIGELRRSEPNEFLQFQNRNEEEKIGNLNQFKSGNFSGHAPQIFQNESQTFFPKNQSNFHNQSINRHDFGWKFADEKRENFTAQNQPNQPINHLNVAQKSQFYEEDKQTGGFNSRPQKRFNESGNDERFDKKRQNQLFLKSQKDFLPTRQPSPRQSIPQFSGPRPLELDRDRPRPLHVDQNRPENPFEIPNRVSENSVLGSFPGPSVEPYQNLIYQATVAPPHQSQILIEEERKRNFSAEVFEKVDQPRGLMEALSRNRPVSVNDLLSIINLVKTDSLVSQINPHQQQKQNSPIFETELSNLLRQVQAAVQAIPATPTGTSQQNVQTFVNSSGPMPVLRGVAVPATASAAIRGVEPISQMNSLGRPGVTSTAAAEPNRGLMTTRQTPGEKPAPWQMPLVNNDVMNELGMNECQVLEAMERVKMLIGNMVGPEQAAKLTSLLHATVYGGSTSTPVATPQQFSQLGEFRGGDRSSESHCRSRSPSPPRQFSQSVLRDRQRDEPLIASSIDSLIDRKNERQGFSGEALRQRDMQVAPQTPLLPKAVLQGPLVPPGIGYRRIDGSNSDRPSQQGQAFEQLRCSLTPLDDLVPRRNKRQKKLAILLRGPPGSGKSWVAKKIKEKEPNARILSIDDYFEVEGDVDQSDGKGRHPSRKASTYQYDEKLAGKYRQELEKLFRKKTEDPYCTCLVVDACNEKLSYFLDMVMYATRNGFEVFIGEMPFLKPYELEQRSTHFRSASDIAEIVRNWEPTPSSLFRVDLSKLFSEIPPWTPENSVELLPKVEINVSGGKGSGKSKWEVDEDDQPEV